MSEQNSRIQDAIISVPRFAAKPHLALNVWRVHVLIVDDDVADTELITSVLKRHADVGRIECHRNPEEALHELRGGHFTPTLILLDVHMPRMDGFQFVDLLRRIPSMREVPVVLLTTSCLARDVEEARHSSVSRYLVKPDTYDEMQERLNNVIKQVVAGNRRK